MRIVSGVCLAGVLVSSRSSAQTTPYPEPQPPGPAPQPQPYPAPPAPSYAPGQPSPSSAPVYPAPVTPQPGAPPGGAQPWAPGPAAAAPGAPASGGAPSAAVGGGASLGAGWSANGGLGESGSSLGSAEGGSDNAAPTDADREYRRESLKASSTINGATGLLRLYDTESGAPGTFRFSLLGSYFGGTGFLCPTCATSNGGPSNQSDTVHRGGGHVEISATPFSFLEAYLGVHTSATYDSLGAPGEQLLQVLGDTNLGVKAFMPHDDDSIFSAGGSVEGWLLQGIGAVGVGAASFDLRGMATADFSHIKRTSEDGQTKSGIPLRAMFNVGYLFDNTGKLADSYEKDQNGGHRITRIQRFSLDINRVDSLQTGIGVEALFPFIRPFLEWTIDIPVNRQDHVCDTSIEDAGDSCLGQKAGLSTTPSRLGLGARVYPWFDGLGLLAAIEIGTGATSSFIEEVRPEMPWNLYLGLSYAADIVPHVEVKRVEVNRPQYHPQASKPVRFIVGTVVEKGSNAPVPDASVKFDGRNLTGMITMADGSFRTGDLEPGTYTFDVTASGFRDSQCSATIPFASAAGQPGSPFGPPAQPGAPAFGQPYGQTPPGMPPGPYGAPAPGPGTPGALSGTPSATVTCELEGVPKVGNVNGSLRDADTNAAVGGAAIKITDKLGRSLSLTADAAGAFRFENVPPGQVTITAEAPNYLRAAIELEVKPHSDVAAQVSLSKRPRVSDVVVTDKELKLKKAVHFQHDSAEILPDSMSLIEEIADALSSHSEISSVEIQGHTDDSGTPDYNLKLSTDRANAVREALVLNGIEPGRLSARGYGQERPLVPNTSEANRARNRRVQLMIQK